MKTAKELLELRNKLEKDYEECIKKEWDNIEKTIDNFKITKECEYIKIPKIENDINKDKIASYGFFIWDIHGYCRLYFDEDLYNQARRHCHSFEIPKYPHKISTDKTFPCMTVKCHNHKGDYDRLLEKINEWLKTY